MKCLKGSKGFARLATLALVALLVCLSVNAQQAHGIRLSWTASVTPNVDGYNIYRGTTAGQTTAKINPALVTALTFDDTNGTGNVVYFYAVTAVKGNLESLKSGEASASFPLVPAAPAGVNATPF